MRFRGFILCLYPQNSKDGVVFNADNQSTGKEGEKIFQEEKQSSNFARVPTEEGDLSSGQNYDSKEAEFRASKSGPCSI